MRGPCSCLISWAILKRSKLALTKAADRGVRGLLYHVLDPSEEAFPFSGRTIFESMGGTLSHDTLKANDLKSRYLERLAARKQLSCQSFAH